MYIIVYANFPVNKNVHNNVHSLYGQLFQTERLFFYCAGNEVFPLIRKILALQVIFGEKKQEMSIIYRKEVKLQMKIEIIVF